MCQQLSIGFHAIGFAISFSKELNSTQGGQFNKEQDVWLRCLSRTKWKAKGMLGGLGNMKTRATSIIERYEVGLK